MKRFLFGFMFALLALAPQVARAESPDMDG